MRPPPPRQSSDADLAAFDATCERLGAFDEKFSFERVDGFLAAVAAGPRLVSEDLWLPALCGDTFVRVFADPEDHARGLRPLQARLRVLCDQLDPEALLDDPDALRLEPLMAEVPDDERERLLAGRAPDSDEAAVWQTGALWAHGFLDGVAALPDLWQPPAGDEAAELFSQAFAHLRALTLPAGSEALATHVASGWPEAAPTRDELITEACMAVQDLRLYWVDFAPRPATRRVEPTPGRNEPCPCGSGRKYKKCHGA
jgi:uncharacterized protein